MRVFALWTSSRHIFTNPSIVFLSLPNQFRLTHESSKGRPSIHICLQRQPLINLEIVHVPHKRQSSALISLDTFLSVQVRNSNSAPWPSTPPTTTSPPSHEAAAPWLRRGDGVPACAFTADHAMVERSRRNKSPSSLPAQMSEKYETHANNRNHKTHAPVPQSLCNCCVHDSCVPYRVKNSSLVSRSIYQLPFKNLLYINVQKVAFMYPTWKRMIVLTGLNQTVDSRHTQRYTTNTTS